VSFAAGTGLPLIDAVSAGTARCALLKQLAD
jgi:hypothetical protein